MRKRPDTITVELMLHAGMVEALGCENAQAACCSSTGSSAKQPNPGQSWMSLYWRACKLAQQHAFRTDEDPRGHRGGDCGGDARREHRPASERGRHAAGADAALLGRQAGRRDQQSQADTSDALRRCESR
eukprot:6180226-Pleurochrysis_carterae.AAC.5